jgi:hypothetical protein
MINWIDADALLEWINKNTQEGEWCGANGWQADIVFLSELIEKINDLATPTPKPQESIFDADGWCWDFNKFKDYYSEYGFLIKTETGYTTIRCGEQYRLCLKGAIAWRPLPKLPTVGNE